MLPCVPFSSSTFAECYHSKQWCWLLSQKAVASLSGNSDASRSETEEARLYYTRDLLPALQLSDLQVGAALHGRHPLPYVLGLMGSLSHLLTWRVRC